MHTFGLAGKKALILPTGSSIYFWWRKTVLIIDKSLEIDRLWNTLYNQEKLLFFEREMFILPDNITDEEIELLKLLI